MSSLLGRRYEHYTTYGDQHENVAPCLPLFTAEVLEPREMGVGAVAHQTMTLGGQPVYSAHPNFFPDIFASFGFRTCFLLLHTYVSLPLILVHPTHVSKLLLIE